MNEWFRGDTTDYKGGRKKHAVSMREADWKFACGLCLWEEGSIVIHKKLFMIYKKLLWIVLPEL